MFFAPKRAYAVLGASTNASKFGSRITQWYIDAALPVIPVNPTAAEVLSVPTAATLADAVQRATDGDQDGHHDGLSVSVVTPPAVTKRALEGNVAGVKAVWFQPGSYDDECIQLARDKQLEVIAGGRCILVEGNDLLAKL